MAQFARPSSDVATGGWTATPLWSKVDEGSPGDDTVVTSDNNTSPDNADFTTTDVSDPGSSTGHFLRAAWNKDASGGHVINAVLELWQGVPDTGTLIATLSVSDIGATEQEDSVELSAAEADAITDYTTLHLRLSRQGDVGGNPNGRRSLVVDFVELEVPDAAAPPTEGSVSDALSLGDGETATMSVGASVSDAVSLADGETATATLAALVSDGVVLASAETAAVNVASSVADALSLLDETTGSTASVFAVDVEDLLSLADSVSAAATQRGDVSDAVSLGDERTATVNTAQAAAVSDAIALADQRQALAAALADVDAALALSDNADAGAAAEAVISAALALLDSVSAAIEGEEPEAPKTCRVVVFRRRRH